MEQPWFRHYAGASFDPKFDLIAAKAKAPPAVVRCAFFVMLELAAVAGDRGTVEGWDDETMAIPLGSDAETLERIRSAMQGRLLDGDRIRAWEKRQPKREDHSTDRVRAFRKRQRTQDEPDDPDDLPPGNGSETGSARRASSGNETPGYETRRCETKGAVTQRDDRSGTTGNAVKRDETHGNATERDETLDEMRLDKREVRDDTRFARIDAPGVSAIAEAAAPSPPPVIGDVLWTACLPYLTSSGVPDKQARSMLGGWRKRFGDGEVAAAVADAQRQAVSEPVPYIEATLRRRGDNAPRRSPFAPVVSNLEVARMFAEEEAERRGRATPFDQDRDGRQAPVALPPAVAR